MPTKKVPAQVRNELRALCDGARSRGHAATAREIEAAFDLSAPAPDLAAHVRGVVTAWRHVAGVDPDPKRDPAAYTMRHCAEQLARELAYAEAETSAERAERLSSQLDAKLDAVDGDAVDAVEQLGRAAVRKALRKARGEG